MIIEKLPIFIKEPGKYSLQKDLHHPSRNEAVIIMADDVEVDLNGFGISGPDKKNIKSVGIYSTGSNTVIKNGSISGFMYGIKIEKAINGLVPENIDIYDLNISDSSFRAIGINQGNGINIYDNNIKDTGGNKFFPDAFSFAVEIINGSNNKIYDNKIYNTFALGNGESVAISFSNKCTDCSVYNNSIKNISNNYYGRSFGIWVGDGSVEINDNYVEGFTYATFSIQNSSLIENNTFSKSLAADPILSFLSHCLLVINL